jgi:ABC-type Na+ efflux pump permease subunit
MTDLGNIFAILRREYLVRARTRSFVLGTALLVIAVVAFAFMPVARALLRSDADREGRRLGRCDGPRLRNPSGASRRC